VLSSINAFTNEPEQRSLTFDRTNSIQKHIIRCEIEVCLHPSVQHSLTLCGSSFQTLEIYSNPILGMFCCQLDAKGKRGTQLSLVSVCSMMCPHSCPLNSKNKFQITNFKFHGTNKLITYLSGMKEIVLSSQFRWSWLVEVITCPSKLQRKVHIISDYLIISISLHNKISTCTEEAMHNVIRYRSSHILKYHIQPLLPLTIYNYLNDNKILSYSSTHYLF